MHHLRIREQCQHRKLFGHNVSRFVNRLLGSFIENSSSASEGDSSPKKPPRSSISAPKRRFSASKKSSAVIGNFQEPYGALILTLVTSVDNANPIVFLRCFRFCRPFVDRLMRINDRENEEEIKNGVTTE
ncbi:hypothetical protein U1Q18_018844 [Sarracenia purpurea var. burkii]